MIVQYTLHITQYYNIMRKSIFIIVLITILLSCENKQKEIKQKMLDNINIAYALLDDAVTKPETELSLPMGFILNCTKSEYEKHCNRWIKKNGGRRSGDLIYLNTKEFGGVDREVRMSMFPYFSDPNTETDIVACITFIFDEFRINTYSNGGWEVLRDSIGKKFDDSWRTVEFNLDDIDYDGTERRSNLSNKYYKYWVKENMAVEFNYEGVPGYATLEFSNIPKKGTSSFKDNVKMVFDINEKVKQQIEYEESLPRITNSAWDGSVWQVKKYLKKTLKDPDSYESIEWSTVSEKNDLYQVRHKYRAKNSFGGYIIEECVFTLDREGNVVDVMRL